MVRQATSGLELKSTTLTVIPTLIPIDTDCGIVSILLSLQCSLEVELIYGFFLFISLLLSCFLRSFQWFSCIDGICLLQYGINLLSFQEFSVVPPGSIVQTHRLSSQSGSSSGYLGFQSPSESLDLFYEYSCLESC